MPSLDDPALWTQIRITTAGGLDLGTWPGTTPVEALTAYVQAHGYPSIEVAARARFVALDRVTFTPVFTGGGA